MLVNRTIREYGYIFVNNIDPLYLKMLANLGSRPIFIYIKDNKRIISEALFINNHPIYQLKWEDYIKYYENWSNKDNYNLFNFDCLSMSELKTILSSTFFDCYGSITSLSIAPFYFFDI